MESKLLPELKSCPMCGKEPSLVRIEPHTHKIAEWMPDCEGYDFIECVCGLAIQGADAWNTRADNSAALREVLEKVKYALGKMGETDSVDTANKIYMTNLIEAALEGKQVCQK